MTTRDDHLKLLHENDIFKTVLSKAASDEERRAIKAYTEHFYMNVFNNLLSPLTTAIQNDPDALKKAFLEIEKELITSGSIKS